ncbi:MAG TPA: glycosyltransferase family 1 protein [Acidimicrobiales bacterium]|nr:glycosyltransferase family 1 protein [Acidimicrobiales bacterium]
MGRLRVAVDATPLIGDGTGVATFTRGAVRALATRAADVELSTWGLTVRGRRALAAVVPPGTRVHDRPMPAGLLGRMWSAGDWPPGEWWTGDVDVVHGTNFVVPPSKRSATVVTVYDLTAVRFPGLCAPASLRYPDLVRRAVRRGAWVHTLATAIADEVVELLDVPAERVRVVPSGLEAVARGDAAAGRALVGAERYILALGTVEPRKGLPDLVRAFDRLGSDRPDLHLVVVGPDGWGSQAFGAAVSMARHGDRVRRLSWVDVGARSDLLAGARVLAVPSVYEGFGYPPLEAMAAGTPVVATSVGSLPEVLGDAARFVAAGDIDALTGALAELVDDDDVAASLAGRGPAQAARYTWDACADGLVELYRDAARAPR